MCLLIVISGVVPGMPLIVAANRDERRARPAIPMTRLDDAGGGLAILGGRDEVGGGTWLATNEAGVVAGLTNRPLRDGPDTAKRSRGELPLALARHPTAAAAVEAFGTAIDPSAYNPSWLLVADRHDAFFVDVTGHRSGHRRAPPTGCARAREPHPARAVPKGRAGAGTARSRPRPSAHRAARRACPPCSPTITCQRGDPPADASNPRLALAARAICVHADEDDYGTRSSAVITVADDPAPPTIRWTDDAPCHDRWHESDHLWAPSSTRHGDR